MSSGLNTIDAVTRRWLADLESRVLDLERRLARLEPVSEPCARCEHPLDAHSFVIGRTGALCVHCTCEGP